MATKIKRHRHLGVKTTDKFYNYIIKCCNEKQMTMTEYINSLIRKDIEENKEQEHLNDSKNGK